MPLPAPAAAPRKVNRDSKLGVSGETCVVAVGVATLLGCILWLGYRSVNQTAAPAGQADELLAPGDLIRIRESQDGWRLAQVPKAQSALVSLDPKHGAIRALVGGMGFELSKFNRATQAKRQPGSNFKPFLYASALRAGITPSTVINDAPVVLDNLAVGQAHICGTSSANCNGQTCTASAPYCVRA